MIGMRNRLIHAYFHVDHDVVWKTIHESLPFLLKEVKQVIEKYTKDSKNLEGF